MRLGFDLTLEQSQKLIMTPELRQAIQLLQFTSQELWQYLENQMEANPLLEVDSKEVKEDSIEDYNNDTEDIDWKEYISQYDDISYKNNSAEEKEVKYENFISSGTSLKDHLLFQLNFTIFSNSEKRIGELIIESIDKNGYLLGTIGDIAQQVKAEEALVEEVLSIVQTFDPPGVGARDIKECLNIQLKYKNITDRYIYEIVNNYLEDVGQNRLLKISKDLNISLKYVQTICDLIKTLEPKPGRGFSHNGDDIKFVTPDIVLQFIDGEYVIIVNDITAPRLIINNFYKQLLTNTDDEKATKFLSEKLNSAMWIIRSIEQRRMTLYKVVESIIKLQRDFFYTENKTLRPLTLKEVAEDIGVHESTVSRATNSKYVQTPMGVYELKYFFSGGVSNTEGGIAATSIKSIIKELIDKEEPKKPLSDQQISNILKTKNIVISRRTVAKYRDELNIPSSSGRRRF